MRRSGIFKVGAAAVAAGAGVILAITSVMAHTSQAAVTLHVPSKSAVASLMANIEDKQDAADAAALLAAEQNKAAQLAEKAQDDAAKAAEEAAESAAQKAAEAAEQANEAADDAAATACQATDTPEDVIERANNQPKDTTETPGANDEAEDTAERAADAAEDATEVPCGHGEHHDGGGDKQGDNNSVSDTDSAKSGPGGEHGDH